MNRDKNIQKKIVHVTRRLTNTINNFIGNKHTINKHSINKHSINKHSINKHTINKHTRKHIRRL